MDLQRFSNVWIVLDLLFFSYLMRSGTASADAIAVMRSKFGIDISSHKSRNVRDVQLDSFDRVIAMDSEVYETLSRTYPNLHSKLTRWEIIDPVGKGIEVYKESARQILGKIRELHIGWH